METVVILDILVEDIPHDFFKFTWFLTIVLETAGKTLNNVHSLSSNSSSHDALVQEGLDER